MKAIGCATVPTDVEALVGWLKHNTAHETHEGGAGEWAILAPDGNDWRQVETITFGWCDLAKARQYVAKVLAGEYDVDPSPMLPFYGGKVTADRLEDPATHKGCHLCA